MQAVPQAQNQVSLQRDGVEIARYHFGGENNRPFVFPLIGPAGRSVTRMGHPNDPQSHKHHYSVWTSHRDVNGVSFWEETGKNVGRIVHRTMDRFVDSDDLAAIETTNEWLDPAGKPLLRERRRTAARWLPGKEWLLIVDLMLTATGGPVTLGKTSFGPMAVRLAKTIGVHDGGGTIRNSEGATGEKEIFWKPARWVDYSGPIAPGVIEGATLFDHPANPNHPAVFHVRDDGWMGAALTFSAPLVIEPAKPLRLRYAVLIHAGQPAAESLERHWQMFAGEQPHEFATTKR